MSEETGAPGGSGDPADAGNGTLRHGAILATFAWGLCSDPGPTREHNEDFAGVYAPGTPDDAWDRGPLFVVADGMGGHAAGEVASRVAVETAIADWTAGTPSAVASGLRTATRAANLAVVDAGFAPGRRGMGTTFTAAVLTGHEVVIGHVGDSRAYVVHRGECTQLTADHSRVGEMVRMKMITPEQAAKHPGRSHLTRSLGGDPFVQVDLVRHAIAEHDVVILCSDGLWDVVGRADLAAEATRLIAGETPTPVDAASRLVEAAIKRDATDNVTAVVVHVTSDRPIPPVVGRRSLFRRNRP